MRVKRDPVLSVLLVTLSPRGGWGWMGVEATRCAICRRHIIISRLWSANIRVHGCRVERELRTRGKSTTRRAARLGAHAVPPNVPPRALQQMLRANDAGLLARWSDYRRNCARPG